MWLRGAPFENHRNSGSVSLNFDFLGHDPENSNLRTGEKVAALPFFACRDVK